MNKLTFEELQEICDKLFSQSNNYFNPLDEIMVGFGEFIPKGTVYRLDGKLKIDGRSIVLLSSDDRGALVEDETKIGYRIRRVPEEWVRLIFPIFLC
jgi:hypothetical protein